MAVFHFPLSPEELVGVKVLPKRLQVMHAGDCVGEAVLDEGRYACDLAHEYLDKLNAGRLDPIFVYEPPLVDGPGGIPAELELVSILLVGRSR